MKQTSISPRRLLALLALGAMLHGCSAPPEEAAEEAAYEDYPADAVDEGAYGDEPVGDAPVVAQFPVEIDLDLPAYAPWPPETPSSRRNLDSLITSREGLSLYDAGELMRDALEEAGYYQHTYYSVPGGFLLATDTERIDFDGNGFTGVARTRLPGDEEDDSAWTAIRNLFLERPPTLYRYIAIVVTNRPFTTSDDELEAREAFERTQQGSSALTASARRIPFSEEFQATALIYEFENDGIGYDLEPVEPGKIDPQTHLEKSGLAQTLARHFGPDAER